MLPKVGASWYNGLVEPHFATVEALGNMPRLRVTIAAACVADFAAIAAVAMRRPVRT